MGLASCILCRFGLSTRQCRVLVEFSPIAAHVPRQEVERGLSGIFERGQCAGCSDDLAERKQSRFGGFLHGSFSFGRVWFAVLPATRSGAEGTTALPSGPSRPSTS